ncbi:MAG: GNAT family N-acetyltransferase [Anaerolineae bacterium]|nr:GNAT family N-acetyltransferase [Anaerolineae bacterium]
MVVEDDPRQADVDVVLKGLRAFNLKKTGRSDQRALTLFLRDHQGTVLGGLLGEIYWNTLAINILWVDESLRGQDWGASLVEKAEAIARESGCIQAHLDTMSFQARPFYEKHGYVLFGQMDDVPVGHQRFYLHKKL